MKNLNKLHEFTQDGRGLKEHHRAISNSILIFAYPARECNFGENQNAENLIICLHPDIN